MILTGWKEISNYLGWGMRTSQRREKEGLPVRRLSYSEKSRVVAETDELDAWLHHRRLPQNEGPVMSEALTELRQRRSEVQRSRCELHRNVTKLRAQFKTLVDRIQKTP